MALSIYPELLHIFIINNIECILHEWDTFAATLFTKVQNKITLRDHAKEMLLVIALDLQCAQPKLEQIEKSKGLQQKPEGIDNTAAQEHGIARLEDGFSINDIVAEYRSLRASVTKLWGNASKTIEASDINDLVRFNEAIDQSVNESVASYSLHKEQQTRIFETALSSSPDISYIFDINGKILHVNEVMAELHQTSVQEMTGKVIYDYKNYANKEQVERIKSVLATAKPSRKDRTFLDSSGRKYYFDSIYTPVFDENGKIEAITGTSRDITERKIAEEKVWHTANYDVLTGLPNRRLFYDRLSQAIKSAKRENGSFSLLFIDLDLFKDVNDRLGHDAGDILLKQTGERIKASVREVDTVARMGGDEFTVILMNINDVAQIEKVLNKILSKMTKPFKLKKHGVVNITSCIGVTIYPQDGSNSDILLRNADRAMYAAKKSGHNRFSFHIK